jgi:hypothetical protein
MKVNYGKFPNMWLQKKSFIVVVLTALVLPVLAIYLNSHASAAACQALPTDKGTASTTFTVPKTGTYRLWAHVYATSASNNEFDLALDSVCPPLVVGNGAVTPGTFNWAGYTAGTTKPMTVSLTSGSHVITVAGKDANVGVDRILLEANGSCVPVGDGANCSLTPASTNTKVTPKKSPPAKVAVYAGAVAILAGTLCALIIRYAARPDSFIKRLPMFRSKPQSFPYVIENRPGATVMTGAGSSVSPLLRRQLPLLASATFGIICGLITVIALASESGAIIVNLSNAQVTGQAQLVANPKAFNGHMVQFGNGVAAPSSASTKPAPAASVPQQSKPSAAPASIAGSACTKPVWSSSDPEDTYPIGNDEVWWVNNDAWSGSHGPQSIYACSESSWYAVSKQPDVDGQVMTYPDTEYDIAGRGNAKKTIAQYNSITSTFSESFPAAGSWDAAYDLWLNDWDTEIMIWNEWNGGPGYWAGQAKTAVSLGGVPYHFYNNGGELMFFRDTQVKSGSVDILAAMQYLVSRGLVKSTDVPTQLEYGVEICSTVGTQTFPMNGLTFSLN